MCFGEKRRARYGNSSERFGRRVGGGRRDRCAGDGCVATGAGRGADDGVPGAAAAGDAESERERDYASENLKVVERYTATGPDHLQYEATLEDPTVFTRPWKISFPLYRRKEPNMELTELKCVEFIEDYMYGTLRKKTSNR